MPPKRSNTSKGRKARSPRPATAGGGRPDQDRGTETSAQAWRMARALRGPSEKYIQGGTALYNANNQAITQTTPLIVCCNGVTTGSNENTRVGDRCRMKWIDLNLNLGMTTTLSQAFVRAYLVCETSALGSLLSAAQFFLDAAIWTPFSQRDRTQRNASRFMVLWDSGPKQLGGQPVASGLAAPFAGGSMQPSQIGYAVHVPLDFVTDYSRGNAGNVTDIDTNSLCLIVCTDLVANNTVYVNVANYTVCFSDNTQLK